MGAYDFNTSRYHADAVIDALRKELRNIVIDSQTSIDNIKLQIANSEKLLKQLKDTVDSLPDYTAQYNEINEELEDAPELLNQDAFANWIIKVEMSDPSELEALMDAAAYEAMCANE